MADTVFAFFPLLPVCLFFIAGIILGDKLSLYVSWFSILLPLFLLTLAALFLSMIHKTVVRFDKSGLKYSERSWLPFTRTIVLLLGFALSGCLLMMRAKDKMSLPLPEGYVEYGAVVVTEPIEMRKTLRMDVIVLDGPLVGKKVRMSLMKDTVILADSPSDSSLFLPYAHLRVGSGIVARSRFETAEGRQWDGFDYTRYLSSHGIVALTFVPAGQWFPERLDMDGVSWFDRVSIGAMRMRHDLLDGYKLASLEDDALALASAMALGDRRGLTDDVEEAYTMAGVSHILSLSGLHLAVIYAMLCFLTVGRRRNVVREVLLLTAVWTYTMIAGAEVPLVRSAIMISICSIVSISGRNPMSLNVLAFTAFILLLHNPFVLWDVSFQLSFAAVAGIMLANMKSRNDERQLLIESMERKKRSSRPSVWTARLSRGVWQTLKMSLAAQLATAPIVAYSFGRLPVYFLVTNLIAIPLTTIILYLSVILLASVWLIPFVSWLTSASAWLLTQCVTALNASMAWIASWPGASIDNVYINGVQLTAAYIVIIASWLFVVRVAKIFERGRRVSLWKE